MTAGAHTQDGQEKARRWQALRELTSRTSLRVKLLASLLALVIVALVAMACVGISLLRNDLLAPYDSALQTIGSSNFCMQAYLDGKTPGGCPSNIYVLWLSSSGQSAVLVTPQGGYTGYPMGSGGTLQAPDLSYAASWLTANPAQPTTVSAVSGNGRWRVMGFPQQADVNGAPANGTEVIALDVRSVYTTIHQLFWVDVIVSAVIVVILTIVGFAVVQANLRPLVEIEETAGEIAEGHLNRRVPERDPRTEIGRLGRSLNVMLSQIEAAFHAREESEAAAHQSEERMRRFIADASHELRTPLTAIRGFAEYYRQRGGLVRRWDKDQPAAPGSGNGLLPDDVDRIMQRLEKEAARMGLLVEDLLLLARMDQQRPLAQQPVDLLSLAADAVHDARLLAPSRTIELSVQRGAAFLVTGDEPRLRQVIGNLMSNALTHTPDGTPIEVSIGSGTLDPRVAGSPPAVTLDVTDHGPGMSAEQAKRVFERFYRADQARTRATGGSGLGLAIVNALVVAHGGVASVRTAPDQGATFRIALPLAPEAQGGIADDDDLDEPGEAAEAPEAPDRAAAPGRTGEDIVAFGGKG